MSAYLRHAEMGHSDAECLEYVLAPWLLAYPFSMVVTFATNTFIATRPGPKYRSGQASRRLVALEVVMASIVKQKAISTLVTARTNNGSYHGKAALSFQTLLSRLLFAAALSPASGDPRQGSLEPLLCSISRHTLPTHLQGGCWDGAWKVGQSVDG